MFDHFKEQEMAAKKRKPVRPAAKKVVKKSTAKAQKKPVAVKAKSRKVVKKAPAAKKVSAAAKPVRVSSVTSVDKAFTKGQLFSSLAGCTGVNRKDVSCLFDELGTIILAHLKKQGPGQFTLPGLVKISVKHKPATKARKGTNPFTGEEMMFKAKPARNIVKVRPLQRLKAMVS
jgi:nucleoid DNA-binding protein